MYGTIVNRCDRTWPKTFQNGDLSCGKLARKKNGSFQSKAVTRKTRNILDSRKKKKSSDSLDDAKVSFQSKSESKTALSGRRVVEGSSLVCFLFSPKRVSGPVFFFFFWHNFTLLLLLFVL